MNVQLTAAELDAIRVIAARHDDIEKVVLIGSRVLGTAQEGSDVDLVLFGRPAPRTLSAVRDALEEETLLPYFFDLLVFDDIKSTELRQHVHEHGVEICRREEYQR